MGQGSTQKRHLEISLLLMSIEYKYIAPVISRPDATAIGNRLNDMYKASSAAGVDSIVIQDQPLRMQPSEKVMQ